MPAARPGGTPAGARDHPRPPALTFLLPLSQDSSRWFRSKLQGGGNVGSVSAPRSSAVLPRQGWTAGAQPAAGRTARSATAQRPEPLGRPACRGTVAPERGQWSQWPCLTARTPLGPAPGAGHCLNRAPAAPGGCAVSPAAPTQQPWQVGQGATGSWLGLPARHRLPKAGWHRAPASLPAGRRHPAGSPVQGRGGFDPAQRAGAPPAAGTHLDWARCLV